MEAKTFGYHSPRVGKSRDLNAFTQVAFYYRHPRKGGKEFKTKTVKTRISTPHKNAGRPPQASRFWVAFPSFPQFRTSPPLKSLPEKGSEERTRRTRGLGNGKEEKNGRGRSDPGAAPQRPAAPRPPAPPFGRGAPPPFCRPHSERRCGPSPPPARPGPNPARPGCC